MEVKLSEKYGYCYGITNAVKLCEENPKSIVLGKQISHNPHESKRLEREFGIIFESDINKIYEGQTVVIRPHGIHRTIENQLINKGVKLIDTTCPSVKRVQLLIKQFDESKFRIVLLGSVGHPEVDGIESYSTKPILVVKNACELNALIENIGFDYKDKIALLSQTTKNEKDLFEVYEALKSKYEHVEMINTTCQPTKEKIQSVDKLSKEVDLMVVIGGKNSSNTKSLVDVSLKNCPTYLVEDENDIDIKWFKGKKLCGLTSGSSTPDYSLQAVKKFIEKI